MLQVDRLDQEVDGSLLHRIHGRFHGAVGRDQNDRDSWIDILDCFQQIQTIGTLHAVVGHDQVKARVADKLHGTIPVGASSHPVALAAEKAGHHFSLMFLVVYDEYAPFHPSNLILPALVRPVPEGSEPLPLFLFLSCSPGSTPHHAAQ